MEEYILQRIHNLDLDIEPKEVAQIVISMNEILNERGYSNEKRFKLIHQCIIKYMKILALMIDMHVELYRKQTEGDK